MKIDIKQGGKKFSVNFLIAPGRGDVHFSAMAKSSKDLDTLQRAIPVGVRGDDLIGKILANHIEKQTKLPIEFDYDHKGAGFGFKIDMYKDPKIKNPADAQEALFLLSK